MKELRGMDIYSLRLTVSEKVLNKLGSRIVRDQPIEDISIRVSADGIHIKGVYPLFINVSFETHWEPGVQGGKITAPLAGLRAFGGPRTVFKRPILKFVADPAHQHHWLQIQHDLTLPNVQRLLVTTALPR